MPGPATPRQRKQFLLNLKQGYAPVEAAQMIGLSRSWANKQLSILKAQDLLSTRGEPGQGYLSSRYDNLDNDALEKGKTRRGRAARGQVSAAQEEDWAAPKLLGELTPVAVDCLEDFAKFRARFFGRKTSPWQEDAAYQMVKFLATPKKEFVVVNAPPGGGKSTLFTHDIPAWLTARSRTIRGFIGSAAQSTANSYTGQLRNTFELTIPPEASTEEIDQDLAYDAQATMAEDYGRFKPVIPALWRREQFTVAQLSGNTATGNKESTWRAWGEDSLFLGWRVNWIIWDDLVTDDMIGNIDRIERQRRWWSNTAERRLEPGGVLVLQGQRMYADDLYRWCLDLDLGGSLTPSNIQQLADPSSRANKKYHHIVYKAHYEDKCKGEFVEQYDKKIKESVLVPNPDHDLHGTPHNPDGSGGCLLDPTRISYEECLAEEAKPFSQYRIVFQQEDVNPKSALVSDIWVNGGRDTVSGIFYTGCKDMDRGVAELPPGQHLIRTSTITVDPSPSRFWSIQWWIYTDVPGAEGYTGNRYLMDHIRSPMTAPDFLDWDASTQSFTGIAEEWVQRAKEKGWPISHIIMETNAAQKFMLQYDHVRRWSTVRGVLIKPHHTGRNKTDAEFGVTMIRPHWQHGRIRLPYLGPEARLASDYLINEVTRYPDALTEDALMAHWFHEYQLQYIQPEFEEIENLYDDMPSWATQEPDTHRLFQLIPTPGSGLLRELAAHDRIDAEYDS